MSSSPQTVSKVDVATRQIREAVLLFFERRDIIVIHTVIASAHQILCDLARRAGISSVVKNTAALKDDEVQSFLRDVNYPYNFFKHADRDPDKSVNIGPMERLTADFIMDAILMLQRLTGSIPRDGHIYWAWFVSRYREEFDNLPADGETARMQKLELGKMTFRELAAFVRYGRLAPASTQQMDAADSVR